jgi:putative ABC transport system permease protein
VNLSAIVRRSAGYYWRTNLAIVLGVATAVSVLAGALLVGDSVRGSLRDIALGRLGRTDTVVSSVGFFRAELADDVGKVPGVAGATPLIVAKAFVTNEGSGRRAGNVFVYGVDERFWQFHGLPPADGVWASPALAAEVGAKQDDVLLTRLQRPSEIPIESLFGRKDEAGRTVRLTLSGVLPAERLGEFALQPQQTAIRAIFAPARRIQRDLGIGEQVNTVLISGEPSPNAIKASVRLEDLGVRVDVLEQSGTLVVETTSGILNEATEAAARAAGQKLGLEPIPVFTYLANSIRKGNRVVPYSLITATDVRILPASDKAQLDKSSPDSRTPSADGIILNSWTARELDAVPGDRIEVEYFFWDPAGGLLTRTAVFTVDGIIPIEGFAADRRLAPEYPGITGSASLTEWDPPFPLDLSRVRPQDERYWNQYRTTPKAFIPYERGRALWRSRYGALTSLRFGIPVGRNTAETAQALTASLTAGLSPAAMGMSVSAARRLALIGAAGATDFGEYFTYFSFFLVVSALMLTVLFFKLGVEQRLRQIGVMRASGYTTAVVRRLLVSEALILSLTGALLGIAGAIAYAELIIYGLKTWWVGAVGTTLLSLHVSPLSLVAGAVGGVLAAVLCVFVSLRTIARMSPRLLFTAQSLDSGDAANPRRSSRVKSWVSILAVSGLALLTLGFVNRSSQAAAFFGAGAALLVACLLFLSSWLRARDARLVAGRGAWAVARLGFRSAASRPGRSVLSAALIASAAFIIVSVDAFRRGGAELTRDPKTGTGGYVVLARSELPIVHNPDEQAGREALLVQTPELQRSRFTRFRVRDGQDASCLNLYRPTNPTLVAPESSFIDENRFTFSSSLAESEAERANPWLLLRRRLDDGSVPVIADATSLQYVLHAGVGETFSMDIGGDRPLVLRFVGALRDSVLQGELILAEEQFVRLFPGQQGYRMFLIADETVDSVEAARNLAGIVEKELEPFGVDAVTTAERIEEFHRVENTYLSTFQALGGLGLVLGTIGLATVMFRNVLERRRELALLRAVGFDGRNVSRMILAESALLLGAGLAAGALCAAIAIAPAWLGRGGVLPGSRLLLLFGAVVASGVLSSLIATKAALSGRMLDALRAE